MEAAEGKSREPKWPDRSAALHDRLLHLLELSPTIQDQRDAPDQIKSLPANQLCWLDMKIFPGSDPSSSPFSRTDIV